MKVKRTDMKDYYTFNSTTELTLFLGIDRETLFARAKSHGIELNGTYTEEELSALKPAQNSALADLNTEADDPAAQVDLLKMKLQMLESQLGYKEQQLDDRQAHIATLKSSLEKAEQNLDKTQTAVDQQQKLQMATLSQLDRATSRVERLDLKEQAEKKQHWWSFGKKKQEKD
ncbi:hypothetical protein PT274_04770 [Leuconostocaceae bacterium ESL0958]|nr:hypothetical protein [Leuconostocaceae bacterium ESL0958]